VGWTGDKTVRQLLQNLLAGLLDISLGDFTSWEGWSRTTARTQAVQFNVEAPWGFTAADAR